MRKGYARNKPWTRDELILALNLYHQLPPSRFNTDDPAILELSERLREIPPIDGETRDADYRSPGSITMKLANFSAIDPDTTSGLSAHSKMDQQIWQEFSGDQSRLEKLATTLRTHLQEGETTYLSSEEESDAEAQEGRVLTRTHRSRERNRKLVEKKKAAAMKAQGHLACEACGFDFATAYGERGEGFIECHHTKPLESLQPGEKTRLADLALLCSNCHRMIHAKRPCSVWKNCEP